MNIPGVEHYREIAGKLREVAAACQFRHTRREILHLAARLEGQANLVERQAGSMAATRLVSLIVALAVAFSPAAPSAREHRSREATREFQREHPCPSTGRLSGACPGYTKDHVIPLACGGPDAVSNLQWQTVRDAKANDHWERRMCGR
jgi:hypothetical protein